MADLLLVDNDARIAELVALFLRRSGHSVRIATSFARARVELRRAQPDLLLSDLDLGEERGEVELPALAREGLLPPTLVVSGYLDRATQIELQRLPQVLALIAKPFDLDALLARVEEGMARTRTCPPTAEGWIELGPGSEDA